MSYLYEYVCIKCNTHWSVPSDKESNGLSSHGLCPVCFREYAELIHKRQCREGAFECFGTAEDFCDQFECAFRFACLSSLIDEWKKTIIKEEDAET